MKRWLKILISYPILVILTQIFHYLFFPESRFTSWYDFITVGLLIRPLIGVVVFSPLLFTIIRNPLKPKAENLEVLDYYANRSLKLLTAGLLGFTLICGLFGFYIILVVEGLGVISGVGLEFVTLAGIFTIRLVYKRDPLGLFLAQIHAIFSFFFGGLAVISEFWSGTYNWVNIGIGLPLIIFGTIELIGFYQLRNCNFNKRKHVAAEIEN